MVPVGNHYLCWLFVFKVLVEGFYTVVLKSIDRSQNPYPPSLFLVIYIFNDDSDIFENMMVGADVAIDLNQLSLSLGNIHAWFFKNIGVEIILLPLEEGLWGAFEEEIEVKWFLIPLRHYDDNILSWNEVGIYLCWLTVSVTAIDPPIAITLFLDKDHPYPWILVCKVISEETLLFLDGTYLTLTCFFKGELSKNVGLFWFFMRFDIFLLYLASWCKFIFAEMREVNGGKSLREMF